MPPTRRRPPPAAVPPRAAAPAPAVATTVAAGVRAAGGDWRAINVDNFTDMFPFLEGEIRRALAIGAMPEGSGIPSYILLFIALCGSAPADGVAIAAALRAANTLTATLEDEAFLRIIQALDDAGCTGTTLSTAACPLSAPQFINSVEMLYKAGTAPQLEDLQLHAGDLRSHEGFAGPEPLRFAHRANWASFLPHSPSAHLPLLGVAIVAMALGEVSTASIRSDANSGCRVGAERLAALVRSHGNLGNGDISSALLAWQLPLCVGKCLLPLTMLSTGITQESVLIDLADGLRYQRASKHEGAAIELPRILTYSRVRELRLLVLLLEHADDDHSPTTAASAFDELTSIYLGDVSGGRILSS